MKNRTLLTTLILYLLTALLLLAVLGRPVLLAAGEMNVPALTLVGAAGLLSGFLAGAYYALTTRPGGAGEAQSPTPPTELTEAEKRSLAFWWDDEPVILDLPPIEPLAAWEIQALTELCHSLKTEDAR